MCDPVVLESYTREAWSAKAILVKSGLIAQGPDPTNLNKGVRGVFLREYDSYELS